MADRPAQTSFPEQIHLPTLWKAVEAVRSAIIVTDARQADNPIIYCNQAFLDLTGYPRDEVMGSNCRFLQGEDTNRQTVEKLRTAISERQHTRVTIKNYRRDGTPFWNDLIVSPVFDDDGVLTHFVGLQLDMTDRVTFEERLRRSQAELESSNKELEQFAYAASHDLKEPLRMVVSYLGLIRKRYGDRLDDDGNAFLGFASDGAERMQTMVSDLLALSRVHTLRHDAKPESLAVALSDALANLQPAIEESGATVTHDRLPRLPIDRTQMTQLLQNLVGNAIKYRHPQRPPEVHVGARRQKDYWLLTVSDNGMGIEQKYYERIFGVFQRLHTRSEYPGNGVGLAICRKIMERHGGDMTLQSVPGQGTVFICRLPVQYNKR